MPGGELVHGRNLAAKTFQIFGRKFNGYNQFDNRQLVQRVGHAGVITGSHTHRKFFSGLLIGIEPGELVEREVCGTIGRLLNDLPGVGITRGEGPRLFPIQ